MYLCLDTKDIICYGFYHNGRLFQIYSKFKSHISRNRLLSIFFFQFIQGLFIVVIVIFPCDMSECLILHGSLSKKLHFNGKIIHTHKLKYNEQNENYHERDTQKVLWKSEQWSVGVGGS